MKSWAGPVVSTIAELVVSSVVTSLINTAYSYWCDRRLPDNSEAELKRLSTALPKIKAVMGIAEALNTKDPRTGLWVNQFRQAIEQSQLVLNELDYQNRDEAGEASSSKKRKRCITNDNTMKRLKEALSMMDRATAEIDHLLRLATMLDVHGLSESRQEPNQKITFYLAESLQNISTLRHPNPQIKGPLSTSTISNLQILKTVVVPESWLENFPQGLNNLRKLALTNDNNNPKKINYQSICELLSHMVKLLSLEMIVNIVPSEFIDTRAFPNFETLRSIKLGGEWTCRKLCIDNVKFSSNLTKLTLIKSGLREDPMPRLERLQALKYISILTRWSLHRE